MLWSGAIADIPTGWLLCDGANGTPDLTDRFIVQAGDTYNPDDTGGNWNHSHPFTADSHAHGIPGGTDLLLGFDRQIATRVKSDIGTTGLTLHLPPYYALAYVMKT